MRRTRRPEGGDELLANPPGVDQERREIVSTWWVIVKHSYTN
jgi:hypothetical protein